MQGRKNTGKVIVTVRGVESAAGETPTARAKELVRADGSYLITGGLGALGLELAQWLARRGAKHLLLMGRSEPKGPAIDVLERLRAQGVSVQLLKADVADEAQVTQALNAVLVSAPPLRGVFHAAGLLDDAALLQLDQAKLRRVLAPKVAGTWNLHRATLNQPLDHFVLFSSIACLFGSPGQGNYAAGNAFLDGTAQYRAGRGLPVLSINWGPWAESGMAARNADESRLTAMGMGLLPPQPAMQPWNVSWSRRSRTSASWTSIGRRWGERSSAPCRRSCSISSASANRRARPITSCVTKCSPPAPTNGTGSWRITSVRSWRA